MTDLNGLNGLKDLNDFGSDSSDFISIGTSLFIGFIGGFDIDSSTDVGDKSRDDFDHTDSDHESRNDSRSNSCSVSRDDSRSDSRSDSCSVSRNDSRSSSRNDSVIDGVHDHFECDIAGDDDCFVDDDASDEDDDDDDNDDND